MRVTPLSNLENAIIKPGFEKHLEPMLRFRGRATLGRMHRMWNLMATMRAQEAESAADGYIRMFGAPEFSHLLGPEKNPQYNGLWSFTNRLACCPSVQALDPDLYQYARSMFKWASGGLTPVSEVSFDSKNLGAGNWRLFYSKRADDFFTADQWAEYKRQRIEEMEAAKDAAAIARLAREIARADKAAELLQKQEERIRLSAERARERELDRERRARSAAPRPALVYPFLVHDGGKPEHELLRLVNAAVPKGLPPDMRADVCQDLVVGILCGDFAKDNLQLPAKEMLKRVQKMFPTKYGPLSLDNLVPGTDDLRIVDTISEQDGMLWK